MATNKPYDTALHHLMQVQGNAFIEKAYTGVLLLAAGRGKPLNTKHMDFIPLLSAMWILRSVGMRLDTNFENINDNLEEVEETLDKIMELCDKLSPAAGSNRPLIMVDTKAEA